jgi:hypothetical protein
MLVASELATAGSVMANAADRAIQQRTQPSLFVLIRTKEREHLHVSGIRGIAVARLRCQSRTSSHDLGERSVLHIGQPRAALRVRVKKVPQTPATRLTFEILDYLRVVMRVTGLAHLDLIHRLGRINMRLHEVQQLCTITLDSLRGRKQGNLVIGNDYSFMMFRYTAGPATSAGQH